MKDLRAMVVAAQAGDTSAYGELVDATRNLVCAVALAVVRDVAASEDVAQEVFVRAWQKLPGLREPEGFVPWMRQLARREALNTVRARRRRHNHHAAVQPPDATADAATVLERAEVHHALASSIAALPEESRAVVILFYREAASVGDVAAQLGMNEAVVKKRLERARRVLKDELLTRLGEGLAQSAPGAAFSAVVAAMLSTTSPALAASSAAPLTPLGAPLSALIAGLGGVVLSHLVHAPETRSPAARAGLRRLSLLSGTLIVLWFLSFVAAIACGAPFSVRVVPYLGLIGAHALLYGVWLPRLIRIGPRYVLFMVAFVVGAGVGTYTLLHAAVRLP